MKPAAMKKFRLEAGLTQAAVALAMGVSQPNYHRWESGSAPVPTPKLKKLARVLKTTVDELDGKPAAFDLWGIDKSIPDDRTYFGEVAIHFQKGASLLMPISEQARSHLHQQLHSSSTLIVAESLDNRIVFVRRNSINDVYFSSEAYDTYGPEEYEGHLGVFPDDDFWKITERIEDPDFLEDEFDKERIEFVSSRIMLTEEELEKLVLDGDVLTEEREKVRQEASVTFDRFVSRAQNISWQYSSGQTREEYFMDDKELYEIFSLLEMDQSTEDKSIYLPAEGYHRAIFVRLNSLDYIAVPKHKFHEGSLASTEEVLDEREK